MAKTRAQRKAERRAREAEQQKRQAKEREAEARAQHDTQVPRSGDIAEIEAVEEGIEAGVPETDLETPDAPAPSRDDTRAKDARAERRERRKREKEQAKAEEKRQRQQERQQLEKRRKQASAERQRGGVIGFLASCWAELKKVQWPDRDTLIQATAVTIVFVIAAAAYLGALDAVFNFLIKRIL